MLAAMGAEAFAERARRRELRKALSAVPDGTRT